MALKIFRKKSEYAFKLERILGFKPDRISLYEQAFTHKSMLLGTEKQAYESNERLEFLGDSILGTITSVYIFKKFPFKDEGFLTQLRSKLVSRQFLNNLAYKIGIDTFVQSNIDRESKTIMGDALEALIGAIYLDKGFKKTEKFVLQQLFEHHVVIEDVLDKETDFKSRTIEYAQKGKHKIEFETEELGEVNKRFYKTKLFIDNQLVGVGEAANKKTSEQIACEQFFKEREN
ncbi:MAG: ribonuclease III [Flavobacteriales bacterium]|nr:ribonuclease III [Flavobacteriales bacterium]